MKKVQGTIYLLALSKEIQLTHLDDRIYCFGTVR